MTKPIYLRNLSTKKYKDVPSNIMFKFRGGVFLVGGRKAFPFMLDTSENLILVTPNCRNYLMKQFNVTSCGVPFVIPEKNIEIAVVEVADIIMMCF